MGKTTHKILAVFMIPCLLADVAVCSLGGGVRRAAGSAAGPARMGIPLSAPLEFERQALVSPVLFHLREAFDRFRSAMTVNLDGPFEFAYAGAYDTATAPIESDTQSSQQPLAMSAAEIYSGSTDDPPTLTRRLLTGDASLTAPLSEEQMDSLIEMMLPQTDAKGKKVTLYPVSLSDAARPQIVRTTHLYRYLTSLKLAQQNLGLDLAQWIQEAPERVTIVDMAPHSGEVLTALVRVLREKKLLHKVRLIAFSNTMHPEWMTAPSEIEFHFNWFNRAEMNLPAGTADLIIGTHEVRHPAILKGWSRILKPNAEIRFWSSAGAHLSDLSEFRVNRERVVETTRIRLTAKSDAAKNAQPSASMISLTFQPFVNWFYSVPGVEAFYDLALLRIQNTNLLLLDDPLYTSGRWIASSIGAVLMGLAFFYDNAFGQFVVTAAWAILMGSFMSLREKSERTQQIHDNESLNRLEWLWEMTVSATNLQWATMTFLTYVPMIWLGKNFSNAGLGIVMNIVAQYLFEIFKSNPPRTPPIKGPRLKTLVRMAA